MRKKIAVLASGRGSNFKALLDAERSGELHGEVSLLITDNRKCGAVDIANSYGVPFEFVDPKLFSSREDMDNKILSILESNNIYLVVLAGYMRIIKSERLLSTYFRRMINIHPSLLPAFKGSMCAQKDAFDYGCKVSGITVHFVSRDVDGGEIILQKAVDISGCRSPDEVGEKILKVEHQEYKKAVNIVLDGKYTIKKRRVEITI